MFIKLNPRGRVDGYLGLSLESGYHYTPDRHYQHVEIDALPVLTENGNPRKVIRAGEVVTLVAAGTIAPKRCQVDVVLNGKVAALGSVSYQTRRAESDVGPIEVTLIPHSDTPINKILAETWFVRLYAIG
jgi:hypothetical protein